MARDEKKTKRTLGGVFGEFDTPKDEEVTEETEEIVEETVEPVTPTDQGDEKKVEEVEKGEPEIPEVASTENKEGETIVDPEPSEQTISAATTSIIHMYDAKTKKKTVEETHNRATFLFRKDLQDRLDKLSAGKRGFKTMFMNKAIEVMLNEAEAQMKIEEAKTKRRNRSK